MKRLLPVVFLGLLSCATGSQATAENWQQRINHDHDAALIPPNAPFITETMQAPAYKREFVAKACDGKHDATCEAKFKQAYSARLAETYFAGNPAAVEQKCQAHPIECQDGNTYEQWARDSHNAGIEASRQARLTQLQQLHNQALSEQAYRQQLGIQQMQQGINQMRQPTGTNCVTTGSGAFINTNCRPE